MAKTDILKGCCS